MSDPLYGQCPYCGRAMGEDHKCWQKSAIGSLKGEFSDPDLLRAEVKRLTAELTACGQACEGLSHNKKILAAVAEIQRALLDTTNEAADSEHQRAESAEAQLTELQAKYAVAVEAMQLAWQPGWINGRESDDLLTKALASTPQSILNLLAVLEAVGKPHPVFQDGGCHRRARQSDKWEDFADWFDGVEEAYHTWMENK